MKNKILSSNEIAKIVEQALEEAKKEQGNASFDQVDNIMNNFSQQVSQLNLPNNFSQKAQEAFAKMPSMMKNGSNFPKQGKNQAHLELAIDLSTEHGSSQFAKNYDLDYAIDQKKFQTLVDQKIRQNMPQANKINVNFNINLKQRSSTIKITSSNGIPQTQNTPVNIGAKKKHGWFKKHFG